MAARRHRTWRCGCLIGRPAACRHAPRRAIDTRWRFAQRQTVVPLDDTNNVREDWPAPPHRRGLSYPT